VGLVLASVRSAATADQPAEPVAVKGLDPVSLVDGKELKGKPELSASRDGFRYQFANAANQEKFEKEPDRYALQFQGQCAMMRSGRARADLFTVYKNRIYGFGSEDCQTWFQKEPEKYVQQEPGGERRRSVAILVFRQMELLDFAGPAEVFAAAGFDVNTVAVTRDPVPCFGVVTMTPKYTLADCPRADVIVIPGGNAGPVAADKRVTEWLARSSPEADITLSVCTGAFILAKAGLLDGKEATTHWSAISRMRKQYPQITVRDDQRVVDTGKVVTSAGVSAGIDGALHVVERLLGRPKATKTARYMEYTWQPIAEAKK
jgi:putative intracellular protease/amidase/YHS domain-containing protein